MCRRFTRRRLENELATISLCLAASACVIPYAVPPLKAEAGGAAHGTGGIGVFAEACSVMMPDQKAAFTATAGVTLRVPSTIGIIVAIPGCR